MKVSSRGALLREWRRQAPDDTQPVAGVCWGVKIAADVDADHRDVMVQNEIPQPLPKVALLAELEVSSIAFSCGGAQTFQAQGVTVALTQGRHADADLGSSRR